MRRAKLLALMISLSLLAGCASGADREERFNERRAQLAEADELSFTARLSADLGDTVFDCTLECRRAGDGTTMRVTEPEFAAGVTVRFDGSGASMDLSGTELYLGPVRDGVPTPARSVPVIIDALLTGHAVRLWTETGGGGQELLCAQVYAGENRSVLLWLDAEELVPVQAQVVCAGRAVISCEISDFLYQ